MKKFKRIFFFLILISSNIYLVHAQEEKKTVKKVVKYRKHSVVDLSGSTVAGKVRTPEIFYIFQRKRSEGNFFVRSPRDLYHHHVESKEELKGALIP